MARADDEIQSPGAGPGFFREEKEAVRQRPLSGWQHWQMRDGLVGALLLVLALGFNCYRLGNPSIWFDEAFSVELARQPLPLLWRVIFGPEPNMELYYLFLHFWLDLTKALGLHATEVVVRLPSAIFAALSTVIVFALGWRFLGLLPASVAALLFLLNDAQLIYAQQARSYSLQMLLLCLAWYALLAALTDERRSLRYWAGYVLAMTLAIYAHLFSVLVLCAQICVAGGLLLLPGEWRLQVRQRVRTLLISLILIGGLSVPLLLLSLRGAKTGWLPSPAPGDVVRLFYAFSGYNKPYVIALVFCCLLSVLCIALIYFTRQHGRRSVEGEQVPAVRNLAILNPSAAPVLPGWSLLCWSIVPLVASYVVSQGQTRLFSARYLVVIVPALFLLVGLLFACLRSRVVKSGLALLLIGLALTAVPYYYASAQVEDWNTTVPWMQQRYQPGDGLVCYDNTFNGSTMQGCQIAVEYYLHAYPDGTHFTSDTPGAFSWEQYRTAEPEAALDPAELSAFAARHPHIFFIVGRVHDEAGSQRVQQAQQWLAGHYHLLGKVETRTVTIYWYATR
ncbi:MAG: glycosyltransferase family 39 protein [Ktedonobacteraceae bacterium]|nr:glycosyltransferase family 39 protein [Ktedonobacteraceae bacterium]